MIQVQHWVSDSLTALPMFAVGVWGGDLIARASFTSAHGFAVNLVTVIALGAFGLAFLSGRPRLLRVAVPAAIATCLADWVLVQDLGMPGGLGTDPNSMVPWALLLWVGYLAIVQAPDTSERTVAYPAHPRYSLTSPRSVISLGALGVVLVGAAPMAIASLNHTADPILARVIAGESVTLNMPAPDFRLVSQSGQPASRASLRGKTVLLTFLDPRCTTDSPVTQELRGASALLGASGQVELVAIAAGPQLQPDERHGVHHRQDRPDSEGDQGQSLARHGLHPILVRGAAVRRGPANAGRIDLATYPRHGLADSVAR